METDKIHMRRCLNLAKKGAGFVSPNPMVGCVITRNGKIIAEGHHKKFGGEHAEINALKQIKKNKTKNASSITVYINLEPCAHYGKTPPCVNELIKIKPKRVVVGMKDPNPRVSGKGIKKLRSAGIEVKIGVLKKECEDLNEAFVKHITTSIPLVILKCAVTLDGALTLKKGTRSNLSCRESLNKAHELRQYYDAIALGVESALIDNPKLTCRIKNKKKRNPLRVVFDTNLRIMENARIFDEPGETIIFTGPNVNKQKIHKITAAKSQISHKKTNIKIIQMPLETQHAGSYRPPKTHLSLTRALSWLGTKDISSLQVEGGAAVINNFLRQRLADKIMICFTPNICHDPKAPRLDFSLFKNCLKNSKWEIVGKDAWLIGSI